MFDFLIVFVLGFLFGAASIIYAPAIPTWFRLRYEAYKARRGQK